MLKAGETFGSLIYWARWVSLVDVIDGEFSASASPKAAHVVSLLVRSTCGSCARVHEQILPVVQAAGARFDVIQLDGPHRDAELAQEFGDRVPVVLVDDEEFACWEVDNAELAAELDRPL